MEHHSDRPAVSSGDESVVAVFVRSRLLLIAAPIAFFLVGMLYVTFRAPRFVAESRVRPQASRTAPNQLAGLATTLGVGLPLGGSEPVRLYAEMAESHELRRSLLSTPFSSGSPDNANSQARPLIDLLGIGGQNAMTRTYSGEQRLKRMVEISPSEATGTIRIRVTTPWPTVSEGVNRRILELLDEMTRRMRNRQASSEREFIEARMAASQAELRAAEQELTAFSITNRNFQNSPTLAAEAARLQRQVDFRQQVFVGVAQSYEQARIDEIRNTPVLGIVDPPEGTARNANRFRDVAIWGVVGFMLTIALILTRTAAQRFARRYPEEWAQVTSLVPSRWKRG